MAVLFAFINFHKKNELCENFNNKPKRNIWQNFISNTTCNPCLLNHGVCKHISGEIVSVFAWSVEDRVVRQVKTIDYKICMAASPLSTQH